MRSAPVPFGLEGVEVDPGDHICAFHFGVPERDAILFPYVREGLRGGDQCLIAIAEDDSLRLRDAVGAAAFETLEVQTSIDADVRARGELTADRMMEFWEDSLLALETEQVRFARLGGDARWWLGQLASLDELIIYESELNRHTARFPLTMLCLYDLDHFGGNIVVELLRTHPKLLMGTMLIENPYYLTPDDYRAAILASTQLRSPGPPG